jgi:two-component system, probable response regulator PhcQ
MKPEKILYVDDEAIALKYFERLVGPLAPVLTAISVEEGRAVLSVHGAEIAVLVCDQRMPGERGNELLRHARQHHPHIVRMLTTAYSEIGEAIDAINTGEIYRYIAKPWELESLRSDLKNALELSALRNERDELVRDKLLAQQSQLVAGRLASLLMLGAGVDQASHEKVVFRLTQAALVVGMKEPSVDWHRWDHADLQQAEARRGAAVALHLRAWIEGFGPRSDDAHALTQLAGALGGSVQGSALHVGRPEPFTALLTAAAGAAPAAADCAWLAWQLWTQGRFGLQAVAGGWDVIAADTAALPKDWLADAMERLGRPA